MPDSFPNTDAINAHVSGPHEVISAAMLLSTYKNPVLLGGRPLRMHLGASEKAYKGYIDSLSCSSETARTNTRLAAVR